jgi:hypothetical protein
MSTSGGSGGGFDDLPPLDEEWVNKAGKREESAEERANRLRRIAAEHERLQQQMAADRQQAQSASKRDQLRPWLIFGAIALVLILLFVVF